MQNADLQMEEKFAVHTWMTYSGWRVRDAEVVHLGRVVISMNTDAWKRRLWGGGKQVVVCALWRGDNIHGM